ncbi:hypothetical protein H6G97_41730 [Nostoc flagelliforme FACHB-838]|uniref:Uncharacterized protein n=1 Tax=Nostoc flagelliforme FACHB-838 TaxID=2692904 RepID=A0ABR8E1F5_9NOSO|nr:hypothetical protein [Nostoc flagelliforme FACHB-838]
MITDFSRFERWLKSKPIKNWTANLLDSSIDFDDIATKFTKGITTYGYDDTPNYSFSNGSYEYTLCFDINQKNLIIFGQSLRVPSLNFKSVCPIKFVDKPSKGF